MVCKAMELCVSLCVMHQPNYFGLWASTLDKKDIFPPSILGYVTHIYLNYISDQNNIYNLKTCSCRSYYLDQSCFPGRGHHSRSI